MWDLREKRPKTGSHLHEFGVFSKANFARIEPKFAFQRFILRETYRDKFDVAALQAVSSAGRLAGGYLPQFGNAAGYSSTLVLVNYGSEAQTVSLTAVWLHIGFDCLQFQPAKIEMALRAIQSQGQGLTEIIFDNRLLLGLSFLAFGCACRFRRREND